jgi:hypothetical protein
MSRHFVGSIGRAICSIPFAAGGQPDASGLSSTHNILALGSWNDDSQVRNIAVYNSDTSINWLALSCAIFTPKCAGKPAEDR